MRGKLTWFPATFSAARQERKLVKNRTATRTTTNFISTLATLVRSSGDYGTAHEMTA